MKIYQHSALAALGITLLLGLPALAEAGGSITIAQASSDADDLFGDEELGDEDLFGDEELGDEGETISPEEPAEADGELEAEPLLPVDDDLEAGAPSLIEDPAPPVTGPTAGVEEILVQGTAGQGIDTSESVSVTAFDAEDLAAMGVQDIGDVAQFTPNLEIKSAGSTSATFFIRGVGLNDFTANASGAVAIYQDNVPLNLPAIQLGQIFDVEGVEVLLGPQGAGPGRNASAGAIKTFSRKPSGELGGFLRTDIGNYSFKDFEGAAEFPLIADILSARVAFAASKRDGLMGNRCGGAPPRGVERIRDPSRKNQRPICDESRSRTEWRLEGLPPTQPNSVEFDRSEYPQLVLDRYDRIPYALERDPSSGLFNDVPPGLDDDLWGLERWAGRAQMRLLPPDSDLEILVNFHGSRIDQPGIVGQAIGADANFLGGPLDASNYDPPEITAERSKVREKLRAENGGGPLTPELRRQADQIVAKNLARRPLDRKPFEGDFNRDTRERQTSLGGFVQLSSELGELGALGSASMRSITAMEWYDRNRRIDADYTPQTIFEQDVDDSAWQVTQDLVIEGELTETPLAWEFGGFFLTQELNFRQIDVSVSAVQPLTRDFVQDTTDFGLFAGVSMDIFDDFTLEGGGRFNWQRTRLDTEVIRGNSSICAASDCLVRQIDYAPSGTVSLTYRLDDETNVYYRYSRGWKGRQMNPAGAQGPAITQADPEEVDAHEVGFSASFFDAAINVHGAAFIYDYQDKQEFVTQDSANAPPQRVVLNAADARIYGAELDLTIRPLEPLEFIPDAASGLQITTRFGWLETEYLDFTTLSIRSTALVDSDPPIPPLAIPVVLDFTGNRLPNTPRFKVSLTADWPLDFGRWGTVIPRYDLSWTDDIFFDPSEGLGGPNLDGDPFLPEDTIGQRALALHNIRLAYRPASGNIEIAGWVRNITNEVYKTFGFDATEGPKLVGYLLGVPRTYGGSIRVEF